MKPCGHPIENEPKPGEPWQAPGCRICWLTANDRNYQNLYRGGSRFRKVNPREAYGGKVVIDYEGTKIQEFFDRIVVISLKRREDRLAGFKQQGIPAEVFWGIDGSKVPSPKDWTMGGGTWGCLQSHRQVLEKAIMDDVDRLLVLEDDAQITDGFEPRLLQFMYEVPADWQGLMLGGQHIMTPFRLSDTLVQCKNCQRTHAYAVRGEYLKYLYSVWCASTSTTHCDWVMGPLHTKFKVYAPDPWLFSQAEGSSDICGRYNEEQAWNLNWDSTK